LLERVAEPRTARQLADHTRLDVLLVEVLLDVGLALGLVSRRADGYRVNDEVLSVIQSPAGRVQRLFIRSDFLQGTDLLQRAHSGSLKPGWHYSDPDILNAQGIGSGGVMETICRDVVPTLDRLTERLSAPGAEFLDVGAGVGGICIALARVWPNLRVVGLEPAAAPLKEAERNIGASAFAERIELRPIRLDELADEDRFDAAWLPQVFLPLEVLVRSIEPFYRSIRPGGWAIVFALSAEGDELGPAVSRFRNVLWGGQPHQPAAIAELMAKTGFEDLRREAAGPIPGASLIIGRKPARR
jgi:SAM-dependent methyltransferase